MTAAAISGTFVTYKHVPTRGVVQLVVEIEIEAQAAAFEALGYPEPGKSITVAVARLVPIAEGHEAASGDAAAPTSPVVPEGGENRDIYYVNEYRDISKPEERQRLVEEAAKRVAEARQHGCHYAEGTCDECYDIARVALAPERSVTNVCDYCGETGHSAGKCPKARYAAMDDMAKARVRASLLAKDKRFQDWACISSGCIPGYNNAVLLIREQCGVKSRSEVATDYGAYLRFLALEGRYKVATGQIAEPRE